MLIEKIKYKIIFLLENKIFIKKIAIEVNKPYYPIYNFINKYKLTRKLKSKSSSDKSKIMISEEIDILQGNIKNSSILLYL